LARIVAVVPDLMLASRVREILAAAGHEVVTADAPSDPELDDAELIVADVNDVRPEEITGHGAPVLGFHRHTDPASRVRAEEAGVALVVPRSRMVRELPELIAGLLDAQS
jgi:hypothetical protein